MRRYVVRADDPDDLAVLGWLTPDAAGLLDAAVAVALNLVPGRWSVGDQAAERGRRQGHVRFVGGSGGVRVGHGSYHSVAVFE